MVGWGEATKEKKKHVWNVDSEGGMAIMARNETVGKRRFCFWCCLNLKSSCMLTGAQKVQM